MDPITLRHKQGKAIFSDDGITIERVGFPRPAPQQIPLSQIVAIHHTVMMMGSALAITFRLANAPTIDLEMVTPIKAGRQLIAAIEQNIAERQTMTPDASSPAVIPAVAPVAAQPMYAAPARQEQMLKVYRGGDCAKQFEKDFKKLSRQGWRVQSQSYGGQTSKAGAVIMFGVFGLGAGTKPREMTVVYVRD